MDIIPEFSLCTYTYNDARLADGLLRHVQEWVWRPLEIIVVDDGSQPAYQPPAELRGMLEQGRVLRLDTNQGPGRSKAAGLGAANGEYILSLDCDIRLPDGWLTAAFELLDENGVGLVGGSVASDAGADAVSCYLRQADHHMQKAGAADFVTGAAWLMPRAVWEAVGGFGGYAGRTHEDHYFCGRLRRAGYKIMACGAAPLRQMLRRFRAWREGSLRSQAAGLADIRALAAHVNMESLQRLDYLLGDTALAAVYVYLELALTVGVWDYLCAFKPGDAAAARAGLLGALADALQGLPRTRGLLEQDLGLDLSAAADRSVPFSETVDWPEFWEMLLESWRAVLTSALGRELETAGVARLKAEERALPSDFSFYGELNSHA